MRRRDGGPLDEELAEDELWRRKGTLAALASPEEDDPDDGDDDDAPPVEPIEPDEPEEPADPPAPEEPPPPPPAASPGIPWEELYDDPTISAGKILRDRPDVLEAFYKEFHGPRNDPNSTAWAKRVGDKTPEAYALYWYGRHGKYEGYSQGPKTAQDNVSLSQILVDRPDVLRAFYEGFYGPGNDRNSDAWTRRVGGDTAEDYARYWYEKYGKWEGYAQTDKAAAEAIDVQRLLLERPDVYQAFFREFFGENNDRKSSAWVDRVGGDTVEDYAKYWYVTHGQHQGYHQRPPPPEEPPPEEPPPEEPPPEEELPPEEPPPEEPVLEDADADPPPDDETDGGAAALELDILGQGQSLFGSDLFG